MRCFMNYIKKHGKLIEKAKKDLGDSQPVEFIELIRTQEVNEGSPRIEDDRPAKKTLQEFQKAISFHFSNGTPYSILHFILELSAKSLSFDNNQSSFSAFCSDLDIFQDVLWTILADHGFLFAEARPLAAKQISQPQAAMYVEKHNLRGNVSHYEAAMIDDIYQRLQQIYLDYEEKVKKIDKESAILKHLEKIADPDEPDWFRRLLRQIIQNGNADLQNMEIDCIEEALEKNLLSEKKLNKHFSWPENKEDAIIDHKVQFSLRKALSELSNVCNKYFENYNRDLSMLQHFSDICEEANDRCKELRAVKKKLVNGLQSVPLLICHSDYLPTFISENLKAYFFDRRKNTVEPDTEIFDLMTSEYFRFYWLKEQIEEVDKPECENIRNKIKRCFLGYCSRQSEDKITPPNFLNDSIINVIAFSISDSFIVDDDADEFSEENVSLTLAPVITYLIFKQHWKKILCERMETISVNLFATMQDAPSTLAAAENDLWLFDKLKHIYARFYGKRFTDNIQMQWDAAFLVYSGYREYYANPDLLAQIKRHPKINLPSSLYYERIDRCLAANEINREYDLLMYPNDLCDVFHPQVEGDAGWDAFSFLLDRLESNDVDNEQSILNRFVVFLGNPHVNYEFSDFLDKALNDLLRDTDGNQITCKQFSEKYELTKILFREPAKGGSDIEYFSQLGAKNPETQCKIVLEYTMRFLLRKRCCERLYNWLIFFINFIFRERVTLSF